MALSKAVLTEFMERMSDKPVDDIEKLFLHIVRTSIAKRNDEAISLVSDLRRKNMKVAEQRAVKGKYNKLNKQQERLSEVYSFLTHNASPSY